MKFIDYILIPMGICFLVIAIIGLVHFLAMLIELIFFTPENNPPQSDKAELPQTESELNHPTKPDKMA